MARHRRDFQGERRTRHLGIAMTPTERAELEQRAAKLGLPISDYARAAMLGRPMPKAAGTDPAAVRALAAELAAVGNNLNQMAKRANQTGQIRSERDLNGTLKMLLTVWEKVLTL